VRAGTLRHRVNVEHKAETRDAYGGVVTGWTTFAASVPAAILPISGREFFAAEAQQSEVSAKIVMRYLDGLLPSMRITHDGQTYNIRAILPDPLLARHVVCMCERGDVSAD
jgi:SPP1 family predicted phage head-tail adaptor